MCELFSKYENEIKQYCTNNNLSFEKVCSLPQCFSKNDIWIQYHDPEKGRSGLKDETPAPIVLKIYINNDKIEFEQTEYTEKYLQR